MVMVLSLRSGHALQGPAVFELQDNGKTPFHPSCGFH